MQQSILDRYASPHDETKTCSQCNHELPFEMFLIDRSGRVRQMAYCIGCYTIIQATGKKRCKQCGVVQSLSNFPEHLSSLDGHMHMCYKCANAARVAKPTTSAASTDKASEQAIDQTYDLVRRHPYKYARRPNYLYAYKTGEVVVHGGGRAKIPVGTPLDVILDKIRETLLNKNGGKVTSATLFIVSGLLIENRPRREWFDVPMKSRWRQEKPIRWGKLQTEYICDDFKIYLRGTGSYFGEDLCLDSILSAWDKLELRLERAFNAKSYKILGDTPAQTGRESLVILLPRGVRYPRLPQDIEDLIYNNLRYQGRIETLPRQRTMLENGVYIIDARWMYASCLSHLPVGPVYHDYVNEFIGVTRKDGRLAPRCPAFYHVTVTVPSGWRHIGLIKGPYDSGYPNTPGQTFSNWTTAPEVALAIENGWIVRINERIYWPETDNIKDPLANWRNKLVAMRLQIEKEIMQIEEELKHRKDDALSLQKEVLGLQKDAIRHIVLHTIGSFIQTITLDPHFTPYDELPLPVEPYKGLIESTPIGIRWQSARPLPSSRQPFIHPEWAAYVWGQARARLAAFALRLPYETIISLSTDSICCTDTPEWLASEDTGRPGSFRYEGHIKGPVRWPVDGADRRRLALRYHAEKRNYAALQQELLNKYEEE